jgi:hypothetical protein
MLVHYHGQVFKASEIGRSLNTGIYYRKKISIVLKIFRRLSHDGKRVY